MKTQHDETFDFLLNKNKKNKKQESKQTQFEFDNDVGKSECFRNLPAWRVCLNFEDGMVREFRGLLRCSCDTP